MSTDENAAIGSNAAAPGLSDASRFGWFGEEDKPSVLRIMVGRLRKDLSHFLSAGVRTGACSVQHTHDEAAFRFLLANEMKRSEQSGRSFHILLAYFSDGEGAATRMDGEVGQTLVPILSAVLRETDYIGWYRDNHVLGGVLTALGDHSEEVVSCRIEHRFWRRMGKEFPRKDLAHLRVRFFPAQEFARIESTYSFSVLS